MPVIDYSRIEKRIMEHMEMDTTLFDLYGTLDKAVLAMKKALQAEPAWRRMEGAQKVLFQNWIEDHAEAYKDNDKVDWVGAFYDWLED